MPAALTSRTPATGGPACCVNNAEAKGERKICKTFDASADGFARGEPAEPFRYRVFAVAAPAAAALYVTQPQAVKP